ncbi:hypothetical protein AYL99_09840 [Fonsecaea erecta]|uniref:Uncharacterized protein n=1 Tax=Fonsecaea erecta TaxID=1367422 RepID=A0A178Z7C8_9EURO|nr:hypothetical protein AYL99_09840 [Fonsecaea erecta]OAP55688.1 hypothetical protein AYL99_09840 [Fonsecaea erecta]
MDSGATDFTGMVSTMKEKDCLKGWDVMVAYQADAINQLFAHQASKLGLLQQHHFVTTIQDFGGDDITVDLYVQLSTPELQFIDTTNQVDLICGLAGYATERIPGGKTEQIPPNLQLRIATSLVNVKGTLENTFTPAPDDKNPPVGTGYPVTIDPGEAVGRGICLDFGPPGSPTTVTVEPVPGTNPPPSLALVSSLVVGEITAYLNSAELSYFIAGISNSHDVKSVTTLQPKSFCFTMSAPDPSKDIKGALCMWMALGDSPGSDNPTFSPTSDGQPMSPLPTGNLATIYFSHMTMANYFLMPFLSPLYQQFTCTSVLGDEGMIFAYKFPPQNINVPGYPTDAGDPGTGYVNGSSFNFQDGQGTLTLLTATNSNPHAGAAVYVGPTLNIGWGYTTTTVDPLAGPIEHDHSGSVNATFFLNGRADWQNADTTNPNELKMSVSYPGNFSNTVVAQQPSGWDEWANGAVGGIPPEWQSISVAAPTQQANLSMDYFLTTNLLFPGQVVFQASDVTAQSRPSPTPPVSGIATPRDTFLTGSINQNAALDSVRLRNLDLHRKRSSGGGVPVQPPLSAYQLSKQAMIDQLKSAILSNPADPFLGDLIQATASAGPEGVDQTLLLLEQNGYGDLEVDDFLGMVYTSTTAVLSPDQSPAPAGSVDKIDLRMFGGIYRVTSPASHKGRILTVNPLNGSILYMAVNTIPTQTQDASSGLWTITWDVGGVAFQVVFGISFDQNSPGATSFTGSLTSKDGVAETFAGTMINPPSRADLERRPSESRSALERMSLLPDDSTDDAATIFGLLSDGLSVISLILTVAAMWWSRHDGKEKAEAKARIEGLETANKQRFDDAKAHLDTRLGAMEAASIRSIIQAQREDMRQLLEQVIEPGIRRAIDNQLEAKYRDQVQQGIASGAPPSSAMISDMQATGTVVAGQDLRDAVKGLADTRTNPPLNAFATAHIIDPNAQISITQAQVGVVTNEHVEALANPPAGGGASFLEAAATAGVNGFVASVATTMATSMAQQVANGQATVQRTTAEREAAQKAYEEAKDIASRPDATAEQIQAAADLETELHKRVDDERAAMEDQEELEGRADLIDQSGEQASEESEKAEIELKKAAENAE